MSEYLLGQTNDDDTDESEDLEKKIQLWMSYPLTHWIVISKDNKIYKLISGFELVLCILSSYYYGYMASFHSKEDEPKVLVWVLIFEVYFGICFLLNFFVEYYTEDSPLPVRDLGKIAIRYLKNEFIFDLIPLIPAPQYFTFMQGHEKHLYFVKVMRLFKCAEVFEIKRFMDIYKAILKANIDKIIKEDPMQAEDIHDDIVVITRQIMAGKIFQIVRLAIVILNICYFLGTFWIILCEVSREIQDK